MQQTDQHKLVLPLFWSDEWCWGWGKGAGRGEGGGRGGEGVRRGEASVVGLTTAVLTWGCQHEWLKWCSPDRWPGHATRQVALPYQAQLDLCVLVLHMGWTFRSC
jgi:hypothetical protein